jgi:hypothetical protein
MKRFGLPLKGRWLIALACVIAISGCDRWRPRPPPPAQTERQDAPADLEPAPARDR